MKLLATAALFLLNLSPLFSQQSPLKGVTYPGSTWDKIANPYQADWDSLKLSTLRKYIIDSTHATGILVVWRGKILLEYGDIEELSYLASARKSLLAMLYGPYVDNGSINLSTTLAQLKFDDRGGLLPIEKKATIKDILTARSGIYHPASNSGDESAIAPPRGTKEPGSFYLYNNWDFNAAGAIFEQQTGVKIFDAMDSLLAKPLEMQDWKRNEQKMLGDTTRSRHLAYHTWLSTRDMARIGYLMLRQGRWNNQQILSEAWVKQITTAVTSYAEYASFRNRPYAKCGYGYMWWIWDAPHNTGAYEGAYTAAGAYGQYITVLPKLELVVAHKTKSMYERNTAMPAYQRLLDLLTTSKK